MNRLIQNPATIMGEYIQPGDTVVGVGCGPGFFPADMAKMAGEDGRRHGWMPQQSRSPATK